MGVEGQREGERENLKQDPYSTQSPMSHVELHPTTPIS